MIRLVLVDVDGTLVGREGVHASTWPAVDAARERGVHVGLCTGRIGQGAALAYAMRAAPEGLHVFQSGAVISAPGRPAVFTSRLPEAAYLALVAHSRAEGQPLEVYGERRFFLERHDALTRVHEAFLELAAEPADLLALPEPPVRAQWVAGPDAWPRLRAFTETLADVAIHPATAPWSPGTTFSNVVRAGTGKAAALRWLAAHLGVDASEVAMVGDGENDVEALDASGLAIAVGNAPASVRAHAHAVVAATDDGGVAQAIALALA